MRQANIFFKDQPAGVLVQQDDGSFSFQYHKAWVDDSAKPPISVTLPKTDEVYQSKSLFPFFYNMLPEGSNKQVVCRFNRIDKDDNFGLLLTTAAKDSIGAVTVIKTEPK